MRRNEARFLTWADVDLAGKVILIRPGRKNGIWWQPKNRSSIRRIAIVPELEVILNRLRANNKKNLSARGESPLDRHGIKEAEPLTRRFGDGDGQAGARGSGGFVD